MFLRSLSNRSSITVIERSNSPGPIIGNLSSTNITKRWMFGATSVAFCTWLISSITTINAWTSLITLIRGLLLFRCVRPWWCSSVPHSPICSIPNLNPSISPVSRSITSGWVCMGSARDSYISTILLRRGITIASNTRTCSSCYFSASSPASSTVSPSITFVGRIPRWNESVSFYRVESSGFIRSFRCWFDCIRGRCRGTEVAFVTSDKFFCFCLVPCCLVSTFHNDFGPALSTSLVKAIIYFICASISSPSVKCTAFSGIIKPIARSSTNEVNRIWSSAPVRCFPSFCGIRWSFICSDAGWRRRNTCINDERSTTITRSISDSFLFLSFAAETPQLIRIFLFDILDSFRSNEENEDGEERGRESGSDSEVKFFLDVNQNVFVSGNVQKTLEKEVMNSFGVLCVLWSSVEEGEQKFRRFQSLTFDLRFLVFNKNRWLIESLRHLQFNKWNGPLTLSTSMNNRSKKKRKIPWETCGVYVAFSFSLLPSSWRTPREREKRK